MVPFLAEEKTYLFLWTRHVNIIVSFVTPSGMPLEIFSQAASAVVAALIRRRIDRRLIRRCP